MSMTVVGAQRLNDMSNSYLDMDNVHTPASTYSDGNIMATSNRPFLYSQTVPTDLNGSLWDATAEGTQHFQGDSDEYPFSFGHITPRGHGHDQNETVDGVSGQWIAQDEAPVAVAEPMRRASSRISAGSHKHRTIKASHHKSRPRIMSSVSQESQMSHFDMSGNSQMDAYLMHDADAHSVSSQMYYPMPMSVGLSTDMLPYSPDMLAAGMPQQHMDPAHMQLDFAGHSPAGSWGSSTESQSRTSSPGVPEESLYSIPIGKSSPHSNGSSSVVDIHSPRLSHHGAGLSINEDMYGNDLLDNAFLSPAFTRRSSGDGESTARDHPLYKNVIPNADGLFHCPWEGNSSCNHRPEKLKCNYDKFVDSHLKPYRCKIDSCENARFSSTACLLRHEREAHAMHGHGDKPYLCTYDGCDRAVPGCGFPRNWNLRDHMRRVHNDNGQSLSHGSSISGRGSHSHSAKGRKRKSKDSSESSASGRKTASKTTSAEAAAAARAAEQPLMEKWYEHRNALHAYLQSYNNPAAFESLDQSAQATEHMAAMEKVSRKLKKMREPYGRYQSG